MINVLFLCILKMLTFSELVGYVNSDDVARVLPTLITWPRTSTVDGMDRACLTVRQENLHLEGVVKEAETDVELHAMGRRDAVILLRLLAAHRYNLMMLTKVDNLLVYHNGKLAVRVVLNETQTGRSASIEFAQVRAALEKLASDGVSPFVAAVAAALVFYAVYSMW